MTIQYDQMFYGRPDSDDALLQQGLTKTVNPEEKLSEDQKGLITESHQIQVTSHNDDKENKANQTTLIPDPDSNLIGVFNDDEAIDLKSLEARTLIMDQSINIPQLDGFDEEVSSEDDTIENKKIFAINCEEKEIVQLINFFRSFDSLWERVESHELCTPNQNCFFCHMRSSALRLNLERKKA